jgi:hypothetical protein
VEQIMQISETRFTPLRRARVQHNILSCLENGIITKAYAAHKLVTRLGVSFRHAEMIVDGEATAA